MGSESHSAPMTPDVPESIAVIILNHRASSQVRTCIQSFQKHPSPGYRPHFIVVDVSCSESEARELRSIPAQYGLSGREFSESDVAAGNMGEIFPLFCLFVASCNLGYSKGNNLGIKIAALFGAKQFLIANPDIELLDSESVPSLLRALREIPKAVCAFPTVLGPDGLSEGNNQGPYHRSSRWKLLLGPALFEPIERKIRRFLQLRSVKRLKAWDACEIYSSLGCFFAGNVHGFSRAGMFDEEFFLYCEENVIGERVRRVGGKNLLLHSAKVLHKHVYRNSPINMDRYLSSLQLYERKYLGHTPFFMRIVTLRNKLAFTAGRSPKQ